MVNRDSNVVRIFLRAWLWCYRSNVLLGLAVFLFALVPRVMTPSGQFLDPDSAAYWLPRIKEFLNGLRGQGIEHLAPASHPGVPLLWLTAPVEWIHQTYHPWQKMADPLVSYLGALKFPIALATSGLATLLWSLLRRVVTRSLAITTAFVFATDPLYLVFSRYLHLDALLSGFLITGLVSLWVGLRLSRDRWIFLAGCLLALATLTRINGIIGVVFALATIAIVSLKNVHLFWRRSILFLCACFVTIVVVWPPVVVVPSHVLATQNRNLAMALSVHEVPPGVDIIPWIRALLYPIFLLTREFPIFLVLGLYGVTAGWRQRLRTESLLVRLLSIFAVTYWIFLLLGPKKIDRYILPEVGPLSFFIAFGLQTLWSKLGQWPRSNWVRGIVCFLVAVQLILFWRLAPYFQTYQNVFADVLRQTPLQASQALDPAWGEGMAEAVAYLKNTSTELPSTASSFAGVLCALGQTHTVEAYPLSATPRLSCPPGLRLLETPADATYLILSRDQIAQRIYPKLLDDIDRLGWQPEKVISINGVPYISIYRNRGGLDEHYSLTGR